MLKVGVTGGIGSGKTLVCRTFEVLGISVYNADARARDLINHHSSIKDALINLLGDDIYDAQGLDRKRVAARVFKDSALLQQLNAITHPYVQQDAAAWMDRQTTPYVLKEAALIFESGSYQYLDVIVGIYAPEAIRQERAMQRDGSTSEEVMKRMAGQMDDEEKMKRCDFVITNDGTTPLIPQIWSLHQKFLDAGSFQKS